MLLLALQLAVASPRSDSIYTTAALRSFIASAALANQPPSTLRGYHARIESELSLLVRDTLGREHAAQIEQLAMAATWRRGDEYDLRVIGYRSQTVGVPYSALSFARSWTIPYLYGDRLTLGVEFNQTGGRGRESKGDSSKSRNGKDDHREDTLKAVHPLASDRDRFYRYSGGDTVAILRAHGRDVPLVRVHVTPVFDSSTRRTRIAAFDGEIDFDAIRHQIVRMRGQFVINSGAAVHRFSLSRLPGIVAVAYVEFVNAEVDGKYWLPAFQRSEFQATFAPLGSDRSIFRLVSRFEAIDVARAEGQDSLRDSVAEVVAPQGQLLRAHNQLSFAPQDSLSKYHDWIEALGTATSNVSASDFDDLAPDAWRATGAPRLELAPTKLDEVFRFNRVEGAYTGVALSERFRDAIPGVTAHAYGGWAWTERTPRGGVSLSRRAGATSLTARIERSLATTNDFVPPLESGGEGFGALFGGIDDQDYVDRRTAALGLTSVIGSARTALVDFEGGVGSDRSEVSRLGRSPLGVGAFRGNRGSIDGSYARGAMTFELHPDVSGIFLEPGVGIVASFEAATGQLRWQRAELTVAARTNFNDFVITSRAQAGLVSGRPLPPQQMFELGGENALPGYGYKQFAGDRAATAGAFAGYTFPILRRPWRLVRALMLPGLSPGLAAGIQGGWAEASSQSARDAIRGLDPPATVGCGTLGACPIPVSTPTNGIRATVDARLTFFSGLLGVGVARPIDRGAPWRLAFRFGEEY